MLRRSRFAHYYARESDVCVFHSLTMEVLFGTRALLEFFLSFPGADEDSAGPPGLDQTHGLVRALQEKGLLVEDGRRDAQLLHKYRAQGESLHRGELSLMYLIPDAGCNLDCTYCFIDSEVKRRSRPMSEATAKQAVRYFFRHSPHATKRKIILYGGEPLLNPAAVLAAADHAIHLTGLHDKAKLELTLLTNGLLVTPELAGELRERNISVSVSIDGPPEVHDRHRRTRGGEPTFQKAVEALRILRAQGLKPSISCTVTDTALEQWERVLELIISELNLEGLGFNILLPGPCPESAVRYSGRLDPTTAILRAFERFREHGIYEDRVMRRAKPFAKRRFHFKDCLGVGGQIAVDPDGRVGPCQGLLGQPEYFPLDVFADFDRSPYKHPLFHEWTKRFPLKFEECLACPAIALCGGGCPIAALREEGSIWEIDRRICRQVKPIHEWLMWDLQKKAKEELAVATAELGNSGPDRHWER